MTAVAVPDRRQIELTLPARRELAQIWAWIAADSGPERATGVLVRVREACVILGQSPHIGRARSEIRQGVRSFPVASHVVLYDPSGVQVRILRVVHGARHLPRALRERPLDES